MARREQPAANIPEVPEAGITPITGNVIRAIYGEDVDDPAGKAESLNLALRRMVQISGTLDIRLQEVDRMELRGYWEIGCEIISQTAGAPVRSNVRRMLLEEIAGQLHWPMDRTYRSIQVGETFTADLMELASANNFTFSATYVIIGAIKEMDKRREVMRQAIEEGWTAKDARANLTAAPEEPVDSPESAPDDETAAEKLLPPAKLFGSILSKIQKLNQQLDESMVALAEVPGLEGDEREVVYRTLNEIGSESRALIDTLTTTREAINEIQPIVDDEEPEEVTE